MDRFTQWINLDAMDVPLLTAIPKLRAWRGEDLCERLEDVAGIDPETAADMFRLARSVDELANLLGADWDYDFYGDPELSFAGYYVGMGIEFAMLATDINHLAHKLDNWRRCINPKPIVWGTASLVDDTSISSWIVDDD